MINYNFAQRSFDTLRLDPYPHSFDPQGTHDVSQSLRFFETESGDADGSQTS